MRMVSTAGHQQPVHNSLLIVQSGCGFLYHLPHHSKSVRQPFLHQINQQHIRHDTIDPYMMIGTSLLSEMQQQRTLFLEEYIASNCTIEFDPSFAVDDTIGTYVTNYVIGLIGVMLGIMFAAKACYCRNNDEKEDGGNSSPEHRRRKIELTWHSAYFFLTAIGYTIAGVQHQIYHTTEELEEAVVLTAPSFVLLSTVALQLSVSETWRTSADGDDNITCLQRPCTTIILRLLYLLITGVLIAMTVILRSLLIVGIYSFSAIALVALYYVRFFTRCHWMRYMAALGNVIVLSGLLVQALLGPSCGPAEAYENCFRDCPLPTDPMKFNHNALFHLLVAIGMIVQSVGWWYGWPMASQKEPVEKKKTNPYREENEFSA